MKCVYEFLDFVDASPTAYQAVENLARSLSESGYIQLDESAPFLLIPGGNYFVTRGGSSLIAFRIPWGSPFSFRISASHSDSPMFKIKPKGEMSALGHYTKLNVERYGGMILSSWFDRPLSVAGRIVIRQGGRILAKNVTINRDFAIIPNVCIHFNRQINEGYRYNPQVDLLPIVGDENAAGALMREVAKSAGVEPEDILASDLFLYNRTPGTVLGLGEEFFAAPRIDNLECAFGCFKGFLAGYCPDGVIPVYALFDNEEVGSSTRQGAGSTFLYDILTRICASLGEGDSDYLRMLASSFMVSADNAHAKHPNHPELSDSDNSPFLNGGVVIKSNANQKYTTDALSEAVFSEICRGAGVPVQPFANRSDVAGGSTLGSISNTRVALPTVDIGMAQLAMHSAYECAGCRDLNDLIKAMTAFYAARLDSDRDGQFILEGEMDDDTL